MIITIVLLQSLFKVAKMIHFTGSHITHGASAFVSYTNLREPWKHHQPVTKNLIHPQFNRNPELTL